MRKTSEEFNSDIVIENIWELCAEKETVHELPYWETNRYLEKLDPESKLIRHYFPELPQLLKKLPDPRNQNYITYPSAVLLMTRILSSIYSHKMGGFFYIFHSFFASSHVSSDHGRVPSII